MSQSVRLAAASAALALGVFSPRVVAQTTVPSQAPIPLKQLSLEELMDIDVTSVSREPEKLLDAPSAIQVITGDDILRSGAASIPEALRLADNLEVAQKNSHDWAISARGFDTALSNKLLVMIDGRTVYTPLFSGVYWDVQDYLLEDIDRIEVISGPGGTQWGANAVNGVINITTKGAQDTQGLYLETGGGSQPEDSTAMRYGGQLAPDVYYRVYGKYTGWDHESLANGASADDAWEQGRGGFRIDAAPHSDNSLVLQGDGYGGSEGVTTGGTAKVAGGDLLGRWTHTFATDSDLSLQTYFDQTHLVDPIPALVIGATTLAPAGILQDDLGTYDVDFQQRFGLGDRNRLVWGLGYRHTHDVVENAPAAGFFPMTLDQNLFSGFVQDEIILVPTVHLTLGTKLEHNDYTGFDFEPSGRLQWNPAPTQTVWAAVSRAVRTPSRVDRDLSEPSASNLILLEGSPDFSNESVVAYELGYRAQLGPKVTGSVALFYNDYSDVRSTDFTPGTILPFVFQNNLEGETHGLELSATHEVLDWWRLHAGYDLLKENLRVKPGATDINDALNETADPQQQWSVRSSMDLPQNVSLDTGLRWVDILHINNGAVVGTVPSYFGLDARLAWHPTPRLEFSIVGQNLLHAEHAEYGFPGATQVEIARGVFAKITWRY